MYRVVVTMKIVDGADNGTEADLRKRDRGGVEDLEIDCCRTR
jgi:hypothetical protein